MKNIIKYNKFLDKIVTYVPGKSETTKKKKGKIIKLSSNESPLEYSKKTSNLIKNINLNFAKYPDPKATELRENIAKSYKIKPENIIFGNGSDELFFLISYAYLRQGLEGLYSKFGFLIYPIAIKATGAKGVYAKEKNFRADVDNLVEKSNHKTKVCFIANPNNPTGTYLSISEIKRLRNRINKNCLLVIDSAYSEYVIKKDYSDSISFAKKRKDIVVTHTFSKIFGMPSLRLGWAYCPDNVAVILNKIRPAFNVNSYAQKVANILVKDKYFINKSVEHNLFWRTWLEKSFIEMGFNIKKGEANFIFIIFNNPQQASNYCNFLENKGILIRKLDSYKLNYCVRITVGLENENKKVVFYSKKFIKEKSNAII
tara:strand:- start:26 stop:1138 length:1113 start_codon:yes stop_codon:yes gene_type:complete